jgi:hypothetical protein
VRRLDINATILKIKRPKSVVEVRTALDPVRAHIEDALALVHTTELPKDVLQRLVPGFCRAALEASFTHVVRRRGLAAGRSHLDIEDDVKNATKTTTLAALAFYGDKDRGGDDGTVESIRHRGPVTRSVCARTARTAGARPT